MKARVIHLSQSILLKAEKLQRRSQAQFLEQQGNLKLRQNDDVSNKECTWPHSRDAFEKPLFYSELLRGG